MISMKCEIQSNLKRIRVLTYTTKIKLILFEINVPISYFFVLMIRILFPLKPVWTYNMQIIRRYDSLDVISAACFSGLRSFLGLLFVVTKYIST